MSWLLVGNGREHDSYYRALGRAERLGFRPEGLRQGTEDDMAKQINNEMAAGALDRVSGLRIWRRRLQGVQVSCHNIFSFTGLSSFM